MAVEVLVLAEHEDGKIDSVTFELLGLGRLVADWFHQRLAVVVLGHGMQGLVQDLTTKGADTVLTADHPSLGQYNPELYTNVLTDLLNGLGPCLLLLGYTYRGMELGPAIATRLGASMLSNCSHMEVEDDSLVVTRPVLGGTAYASLRIQRTTPLVLSFQKGALPASAPSSLPTSIVPVTVKADEGQLRTRVTNVMRRVAWEVDLTKADIIVTAGRGIGSRGNLDLVRGLADALGGMVGCSRPIADMGWLPADHVVGLSGRTVTPKVYLACGVSGAAQHIAGMKDAKRIIAINKDPDAPIFRVAHYGVVGDVNVVIPLLIEQAKKGVAAKELGQRTSGSGT